MMREFTDKEVATVKEVLVRMGYAYTEEVETVETCGFITVEQMIGDHAGFYLTYEDGMVDGWDWLSWE